MSFRRRNGCSGEKAKTGMSFPATVYVFSGGLGCSDAFRVDDSDRNRPPLVFFFFSISGGFSGKHQVKVEVAPNSPKFLFDAFWVDTDASETDAYAIDAFPMNNDAFPMNNDAFPTLMLPTIDVFYIGV